MIEDTIQLPPILRLPWPKEASLHPHAYENYLEFFTQVLKEPLGIYLASEDDLRLVLSGDEFARFEACEHEIREWLQKCRKDNDEVTLRVYPYHSPFNAMSDLKKLIAKVTEGAVLKVKRTGALNEIRPPFVDGKRYLDAQEYGLFIKSLAGAADAFLGADVKAESLIPDIWKLRAPNYSHWLLVIRERKEEETRRKQAEAEYDRYLMEINGAIKKFRESLKGRKKPSFSYPPPLAPYKPHLWHPLEVSADGVKEWVRQNVKEKLPPLLRDFISYDVNWETLALPRGSYVDSGVPCIRWDFKILLLAQVYLRLTEKTFARQFQGYEYSTTVKAEEIGCLYLGPVEWGVQEGFAVPVSVLRLFATGALEAPGIKILSHDGVTTVYTVDGYDEDSVEVRTEFVNFIKSVSKNQLPQTMLSLGMVDDGTAKLLEAKWNVPLPTSAIPPVTPGEAEVVDKLTQLGWSEDDAKKAVAKTPFPDGASTEEAVKTILAKWH